MIEMKWIMELCGAKIGQESNKIFMDIPIKIRIKMFIIFMGDMIISLMPKILNFSELIFD
jgi:hypothetical protein